MAMPFSADFDGAWLRRVTRNRGAAIKQVLMDGHVVAGVGNIYANEALFRSGISPKLPGRRIGLARYQLLAEKIRETLELAIGAGGSTLRDYVAGARASNLLSLVDMAFRIAFLRDRMAHLREHPRGLRTRKIHRTGRASA